MRKLLTVCLVAVAFCSTITYSNDKDGSASTFLPGDFSAAHKIGDVTLSITDRGLIELYDRVDLDSSKCFSMPLTRAPNHLPDILLLSGTLWIGALVEDTLNRGEFDTLVTTGGGGWQDVHEFQPANSSEESVWKIENIADNEVYTVFYDVVTDPDIVGSDPFDGRPHLPLGLKITQRSLSWNSPSYDKYAVVDFYIENIYNRDLREIWLGLLLDENQKQSMENSRPGSANNRAGFIDYEDHGIGWLSNNNIARNGNLFNSHNSNNIIGLMLVGSSRDDIGTNFNWWVTDIDSRYNWGPQWQSNFDIWGTFPGGGKGSPEGDIAKYCVMSNGEIDYDQALSDLNWADGGWITNDAMNRDNSDDGFYTNMLISFGPFDMNAGKVETVTVAFLTGSISDRQQYNLTDRAGDYSADSILAADYYSGLDFSGIPDNADTILSYYEHGFDKIPPGPPRNFSFESWDNNQINLTWNRHYHVLLGDYRVYRGTEPGVYGREPITPAGFIDTFFVDNTVLDNTVYYYVIKSANIYGDEGGASPEIIINSGQPQTPDSLTSKGGNARAEIGWRPNSDDDLRGYIIYRNIAETKEFEIIDTVNTTTYIDAGLNNGIRYRYKVQALDLYGNLSYYSDSVTVIPMAFDSGIMLVNANIDSPANPDYDSMTVFYESVLDKYQHIIVYECPVDLPQLSPYSTIIWCKEILPGRIRFDQPEYLNLFSDYLDAGGRLIIAGTRIINNEPFEGLLKFNENGFCNNYLNLDGIDYPSIANVEFAGGRAGISKLPDFVINPFKAGRMTFPFENRTNRLFGIGALMPLDSAEIIYDYIAINPDTSRYNERPIAIIHETDMFKTAVLEFPLYYVEEIAASEILYQVLDIFGETVDIEEQMAVVPEDIELMQNFPNPFNFRTEIRYILPGSDQVSIEVFDILGRNITKLVDEIQEAGQHSVIWDGRNSDGQLSTSGIYFYRLTTKDEATTKRMLFLK